MGYLAASAEASGLCQGGNPTIVLPRHGVPTDVPPAYPGYAGNRLDSAAQASIRVYLGFIKLASLPARVDRRRTPSRSP